MSRDGPGKDKKVQLLTSVCESYTVQDFKAKDSQMKRRRTQPAVRSQTSAAFLSALSDGDVKTAHLLLESNINVHVSDKLGRTPLHFASCLPPSQTSLQICTYIITKSGDINKGDVFGMTPFCYAVSSQNIAIVREMLKRARVDKIDKFGNTSLHHAVATGNLLIVTAIAKISSSVNKINILGFTPLMIASKLGHVNAAKVLAQCGAVSGSIRDAHSNMTANEWARFSDRFSEMDLRDIKDAEKDYKKQTYSHTIRRSCHPDCKSNTEEVYRTASRTLPISVGSADDQTQLMIKRVMLLRKLSEFFNNTGKRVHMRGGKEEPRVDLEDTQSGAVSSISVNDLLDEHLSKLSLSGGKLITEKKSTRSLSSTGDGSGDSEDSILERQAKIIEKTVSKRRHLKTSSGERLVPEVKLDPTPGAKTALEPSIVTLVHNKTPHNSVCSRDPSPVPPSKMNKLSMSPELSHSPDGDEDDAIKNWSSTIDQEFKAPKVYTTKQHVPMQSSLSISIELDQVKSFPRANTWPKSDAKYTNGNSPYRRTQQQSREAETILLCEKVRYGKRASDVPANKKLLDRRQSLSLQSHGIKRVKIRPKKSAREKTVRDPISGFGPWVTENPCERTNTFLRSLVPEIKVNCLL